MSIAATPSPAQSPVRVLSLLPKHAAQPLRQVARRIDGQQTDVLCQAFADRILVLVTQVGKVGYLTQVTTSTTAHYVRPRGAREDDGSDDETDTVARDTAHAAPPAPGSVGALLARLPPPLPGTLLSPLLGAPPAGKSSLYALYASQIASIVRADVGAGAGSRPLVVGLALRHTTRATPGQSWSDADDAWGEEELGLQDEAERNRFATIMDMVIETRVW